MFKEVKVYANFNERTGYGIHASRFFPRLQKLVEAEKDGSGSVSVSLLDVVSAGNAQTFPESPSILFNVWESTEYPEAFMQNLSKYDMLWVPSEWQRAISIAQGVPEECVKVVPEGVDVDIYRPLPWNDGGDSETSGGVFRFVTVGQWQPRKSTQEIIESFIKAFPIDEYPNVRLELSVDTLFPSDTCKSTEERLERYGLQDSRLVVVHFEEREDYVRRLQTADCFVSCARSEGWGLPIIEAMACGVPTIVADWSGSTEYATDAVKVRVRELIKPFGIYCDWDVPGQWCQPDYDHLVEQMRNVYNDRSKYKIEALKSAERIRRDFNWDVAAEKAMVHLREFHQKWNEAKKEISVAETVKADDPEAEIRAFAARLGYEIKGIEKRSAIFAVDCWPNSEEKMETLRETIAQIKKRGYPVLVSSHYPLPVDVIKETDFYIFEQRDIMSGDDKPVYWRKRLDGTTESKQASVEYQGVAAINGFRNSIDFCRGRYDWVYQMGADMEVDLDEWLRKVHESQKPMVCIPYEGNKDGIGGGLWAGKTEVLDRYIPRLNSWKEYADKFPDLRFVAEKWLYAHLLSEGCNFDEEVEWIDVFTQNRFDNVDRDIWEDDDFAYHFVDGPFLEIVGISRRQYDVAFIDNANQENVYGIKQNCGAWSRASHKYFRDWTITASLDGVEKFRERIDLSGKNVVVSFGSKALGDTIAWMPYVDEFRKKHNISKLYCSGWWQEIFDYPEIEFVKPGTALPNIYASYSVGCFDNQPEMNPVNWRSVNLQQVASDILGLEYKPLRAKLKIAPYPVRDKKYVCFSEFSTMRGKIWNRPGAWQNIVDYLNSLGYECISVASERTGLKNVIVHAGQPIQKTISDIAHCDFYVGLNHGPAWIATALNKPMIMITGMSEPWNDFPNPYRLSVDSCRPGCFNDPSIQIERGWEWCPRNRDYACTKDITEEMVIGAIDKIVEELKCQPKSKRKKGEDTKSERRTGSMQKTQRSKKQSHSNASLMQ